MLDSLLYEPKRRKSAMVILLALLVLAVGFVALGWLVEGLAVMGVFGVAFLSAAIALLGKLLVVSHVHLRGTASRLEALNSRYDATSRWLERYDADTRESFIAARDRFEQADADRLELLGEIEKLAGDTPRAAAFVELEGRVEKATRELESKFAEAETAHAASLSEVKKEFEERLVASVHEVDSKQQASDEQVEEAIKELRGEIDRALALADRIDSTEERIESTEGRLGPVEAQLGEQAGRLIESEGMLREHTDTARESVVELLSKARAELDDQIRLVNGRVSKIDDEHERKRKSAAHAVGEQAKDAISQVSKRIDDAAQLVARQRGDGYTQFPRLMSAETAASLSSFGIKASPAELKYLERKLQVIEGLCEGRLAGSTDDAIGRSLAGRMVKSKELKILEIGVLFGVGAAFMHHVLAPRFTSVKLALLDPFEGYYGKDHLDPLTGLPVNRMSVERNLERCGVPASDYEILEGFSTDDEIRQQAEAAGPYHVIVIDGDHTADGIRLDFERYASMLRAGGVLIIDDYGSDDWPAVTEYVDSVVKEDERFKLVVVLGKTAVFKRLRSPSSKKVSKKRTSKKASDAKVTQSDSSDATSTESGGKAEEAGRGSIKVTAESTARSQDLISEAEPPVPVVKKRRTKKRSTAKMSADDGVDSSTGS